MLCVLNFSLCTGGQCYSVGSYWAVALFVMMHEVVLAFKSVDETPACRFKWKLRNKSCVVEFIMLSKFGLTSMLTNKSSVLCNNQECPLTWVQSDSNIESNANIFGAATPIFLCVCDTWPTVLGSYSVTCFRFWSTFIKDPVSPGNDGQILSITLTFRGELEFVRKWPNKHR